MHVEAPCSGCVSTLRVGVWGVHASPRDNWRAIFSTRQKGRRQHAPQHATPRAHSVRTVRSHSRLPCATRKRFSSLLGSPPKEACEWMNEWMNEWKWMYTGRQKSDSMDEARDTVQSFKTGRVPCFLEAVGKWIRECQCKQGFKKKTRRIEKKIDSWISPMIRWMWFLSDKLENIDDIALSSDDKDWVIVCFSALPKDPTVVIFIMIQFFSYDQYRKSRYAQEINRQHYVIINLHFNHLIRNGEGLYNFWYLRTTCDRLKSSFSTRYIAYDNESVNMSSQTYWDVNMCKKTIFKYQRTTHESWYFVPQESRKKQMLRTSNERYFTKVHVVMYLNGIHDFKKP